MCAHTAHKQIKHTYTYAYGYRPMHEATACIDVCVMYIHTYMYMSSTIFSYLHNNSFHFPFALKLHRLERLQNTEYYKQFRFYRKILYLYTHIHMCFSSIQPKSSRKRFQRESNQTVHYTHTHTHTCTDIQKQKHARICNCLKIITILYAQF